VGYRRSAGAGSSNFIPASPGPIGGITPSAGTFTTLTGSVSDKGGQVFNAQAYGWLPDGTNRSTQALALLTAMYNANGGTLWFPGSSGAYRCDSQLLIPNDGGSPQPKQPNIRFSGSGGGQNWYSGADHGNGHANAAVLDLRYTGTGAKITTLGLGAFAMDNLLIKDGGGSNTTPLFLTTNTTSAIRENTFWGSGNVAQDAIVLGGPNAHIGGAITDGFQGYGTNIMCNHFTQLNRGLYGRTYCNSINFNFNSFQNNVGTRAIESDGSANQNYSWNIIGNLIEMDVYSYGIYLGYIINAKCIGNDFWDVGNNHVADIYLSDAACTQGVFILGHHEGLLSGFIVGNAASIATAAIIGSGKSALNSSNVSMASLPASDPHVVGQLWRNSGVVTVSAG
jgi:hypothetical protein